MKHAVFLIIFLLFPFTVFAENSFYIFLVDENSQPLLGYKVLPTQKEDIFSGKIEPVKKWITITKSDLFLVSGSYLYKVKDSIILDKAKGIVLFLIDFNERKPLYFNPEETKIDRDVGLLIKNKNLIFKKVEEKFPLTDKKKEVDALTLANQYETSGQIEKALTLYEEILKNQPVNTQIIDKVATLYYRIGNFAKAKDYLMKLPQNQENIIKLAGILLIERKFEEALKVLNNPAIRNLPYCHYLKGIIYYLSGQKNEAYSEVIELSKHNKELSQSLRDLLR